jgi:signal transduction histidine kinase
MNFRYRLALFLIVTLAAIQALTAICAYTYLRASLVDKAKRELVDATGNFMRQLDILSQRATGDVEILSLDYALRQAIAQQDYGTELSALRNHGRRVGATRMMLVGLDGTITADTGAASTTGRAFAYSDILGNAANTGESAALANLEGKVYWIVVVPVRAPVPIAFIAACIPVDDALLEKLRTLSTMSRSIALATTNRAGHWTIVGRTANGPARIALPETIAGFAGTKAISGDNGDYLTVTTRLTAARDSAPVLAVLAYPLKEAFAAYRVVVVPVLIVLALALLAAVGGAFLVVRSASRPLEGLAGAARRIAGGDYSPPLLLTQSDEIGQLSQALSTMTQSIAEREAALTSAIGALEIARNEAVSASEAKSQFLTNMSHELRTPLNAIVGFGEMLQQQVLGPLGVPRYVEYANDICSSGQHLLGQVSRMLELADVEAGTLTIAKRDIDAGDLLAQCVASVKLAATIANVAVSYAGETQAWHLTGDAPRLRQAFTNILQNAVKFTPSGGCVLVSAAAESGRFVVRIEDTGIGMNEADIALVIRPFYRLRHALDGRHQGAGLGLPYAHAIVALHGGELKIKSALHAGTTVEIVLPLAGSNISEAA